MSRRQNKISAVLIVALTLVAMASCSLHKNTAKTRWWKSFNARYNTYYNGSQAYIDGSQEKEKANKDNFTELLPFNTVGNKKSREAGKGNFDRAIEKSEKAIKKYSVKNKPEWKKSRRKTARDKEWLSRREYNPFLWKAWLLLGKSQFQKGAFDEAAATFSYMTRLYQNQPMQAVLAKSWLAQSYMELDWLYDAEDVMRNLSRDSIHYKARKDWNAVQANYYLKARDFEKALPHLRQAAKDERHKVQKARLWYIVGQVESELGHRQEAYKAYQKVIRQNPPYEMEFNARIAQTEVMAKGNSRKMIRRLRQMARSDKNKDMLEQVYYAIGNIYMMQNDTLKAIAEYEKGAEKATRTGIEKGVLLLRLGNIYWDMERYNDAQRCLGEAVGLLDQDRPDYAALSHRSKVLDELVPHTDAIHLQDSLQELARMPEAERLAAIDRVIDELKKKEKEEQKKAREAEVEEALKKQEAQGGRRERNTPTPVTPAAGGQKDGQWYFYNPMAVSQGKQQFQRLWGKRENVDNWRRNNQTVVSLDVPMPEDESAADSLAQTQTPEGEAPPEEGGKADEAPEDTLQNDPHNREYYLAQIPFTEEQVAASDDIIKEALLQSGIIFKDKLGNLRLAEKNLNRLKTQYPDYPQMDLALYHLFLLYSLQDRHDTAGEVLQQMVESYPESDWTILLSDPNFAENQKFGEHIEDSLYAATYNAFTASRYDEVKANSRLASDRFPLGEHRPKFVFINGLTLLNEGDAAGCVESLTEVVEKYPQSEVSEMAGMILKGVKEGRQLYGGKFDLADIWARRDITLADDSTSVDTLSAERNTEFLFILAYIPDSLMATSDKSTPLAAENQLLFEMARHNFTNFMVRNFDITIDQDGALHRMIVSGFLNYDEARQYARALYKDVNMAYIVRPCRSLVISTRNLALMGTRYSYQDYEEFYERTFVPLEVSAEELLQIPTDMPEPKEPDEDEEDEDEQPAFDDDFF